MDDSEGDDSVIPHVNRNRRLPCYYLYAKSRRLTRFFFSMRWLCLLTALAAVCAQSNTVDSYIASELPIAKASLLANIGPNGFRSSGAYVSSSHTSSNIIDHVTLAWHSDRQSEHVQSRLSLYMDPRLVSRFQSSHRPVHSWSRQLFALSY